MLPRLQSEICPAEWLRTALRLGGRDTGGSIAAEQSAVSCYATPVLQLLPENSQPRAAKRRPVLGFLVLVSGAAVWGVVKSIAEHNGIILGALPAVLIMGPFAYFGFRLMHGPRYSQAQKIERLRAMAADEALPATQRAKAAELLERLTTP